MLFSVRDDPELVVWAEKPLRKFLGRQGQGNICLRESRSWATPTDEIKIATGIVNVFLRPPARSSARPQRRKLFEDLQDIGLDLPIRKSAESDRGWIERTLAAHGEGTKL